MPWIKKIEKSHYCPGDKTFPDPQTAWEEGIQLGSIYECDREKCLRRWMLSKHRDDWVWVECL